MPAAAQRRRLIFEALSHGPIASQDELRDLLAEAGCDAAQATLSRDLRSIGAVKGADGYFLPAHPPHAVDPQRNGAASRNETALTKALAQRLLSVCAAGSLVVLRTEPGNAPALAAALDAAPPAGTAGTVAGDDTIFVAASSAKGAAQTARGLAKLAGLE